MAKPLAVCVIGAAGRMGKTLIGEIARTPDKYILSGALEHSASPFLGQDAGTTAGIEPLKIKIGSNPEEALKGADIAIDFSAPSALKITAAALKAQKCPLLLATTALSAADEAALKELSQETAVLAAPNFSLGIYALRRAVKEVARLLADKGFEAELLEIHHKHKKDAPSGTAKLLINDLIESGIAGEAVYDRAGKSGAREADSLGVAVLRGGDVAGEHKVYFLGEGERLELAHLASGAQLFPRGALKVALWLIHQKPGRYTMDDFFGA